MSEGDCLQRYVSERPSPPFLFFVVFFFNFCFVHPLSHEHLGTILKTHLFHFNVLYTFVLLMDMIAFLVFNNGGK